MCHSDVMFGDWPCEHVFNFTGFFMFLALSIVSSDKEVFFFSFLMQDVNNVEQYIKLMMKKRCW